MIVVIYPWTKQTHCHCIYTGVYEYAPLVYLIVTIINGYNVLILANFSEFVINAKLSTR